MAICAPAQPAHLLGALAQQVLAVEEDFAADNAAARLRHQAHNRQAGHGLAGAGLADNPQRFARADGEAAPSTAFTTPRRV